MCGINKMAIIKREKLRSLKMAAVSMKSRRENYCGMNKLSKVMKYVQNDSVCEHMREKQLGKCDTWN